MQGSRKIKKGEPKTSNDNLHGLEDHEYQGIFLLRASSSSANLACRASSMICSSVLIRIRMGVSQPLLRYTRQSMILTLEKTSPTIKTYLRPINLPIFLRFSSRVRPDCQVMGQGYCPDQGEGLRWW